MIQWRNVSAPDPYISARLTLVDNPESPTSPLPCTYMYPITANRLASKSDLGGYHLRASDNVLSDVYHDWVLQNPGKHLYGGIDEDGKWQDK